MAQRVIGNIRQRIVLRLRDLIDNLRLAHARIAEDCDQIKYRYDAKVHNFLTVFFGFILRCSAILLNRNTQQLIWL